MAYTGISQALKTANPWRDHDGAERIGEDTYPGYSLNSTLMLMPNRIGICQRIKLLDALVEMSPMIAKKTWINLMPGNNREFSWQAAQCQVFHNTEGPVVKQHMMIGAETKHVFRNIWAVMRRTQRLNM